MAESVLLDASAVLALLQAEAGAEAVAAALESGLVSAVTRTEILGRLARFGADGTPALDQLALPVLPFTAAEADRAAALIARHRGTLSLGDCACLATAERLALPVLTADRIWATLGLAVEVRLVR
ncbi:PIN domain-containing protein [Falsiroseomonas sp. E2-1-a20]|uniref:PIN domain-containing protein n=1 Tax=Falsiroseomonas sp. E2-1-a20 TaxID=3239300 RepID=UPI003F2D7DC0